MRSGRGWTCAVVAVSCLLGCASPPPSGREPTRLSPATVEFLPAVVVDLDPEGETVTVKETTRYETWRVAMAGEPVVRTADGTRVGIAELRIGDRVEIRGTSRVEGLITAYEITLVDRWLDKEEGIAPLPSGGGAR